MREARNEGASHHETAGLQFIARALFYLICLTSQKGLIYSSLPLHDLGVSRNLLAACKTYEIAQDERVGRHHHVHTITDRNIIRHVKKRELVQYLLRAELLNDANDHVCNHDR